MIGWTTRGTSTRSNSETKKLQGIGGRAYEKLVLPSIPVVYQNKILVYPNPYQSNPCQSNKKYKNKRNPPTPQKILGETWKFLQTSSKASQKFVTGLPTRRNGGKHTNPVVLARFGEHCG